jgi:hypothetical protein
MESAADLVAIIVVFPQLPVGNHQHSKHGDDGKDDSANKTYQIKHRYILTNKYYTR